MKVAWAAYGVTLLLAYVVPGPDFLLVLHWGTRSRREGLAAGLGAQAGLSVHVLLAVAGLTALITAWPTSLTFIRYLGAAYLLWLGLRMALSSPAHGATSDSSVARGHGRPPVRPSVRTCSTPRRSSSSAACCPSSPTALDRCGCNCSSSAPSTWPSGWSSGPRWSPWDAAWPAGCSGRASTVGGAASTELCCVHWQFCWPCRICSAGQISELEGGL